MAIRFNRNAAREILRREANRPEAEKNAHWIEKVERLSKLCESAGIMTHIAFLGTALLAKSLDPRVDLYAIKPTHSPDNPNAFSARSLAHSVLVPLAAELGISLGVTGREPLNNQPYFRMRSLNDGTPVHTASQAPFDYMLQLIDELQNADTDSARAGLSAFIWVRRTYQPNYKSAQGDILVNPITLADAISTLVTDNSEGGKRAQAVAAGLLDVYAGPNRITAGRINDPSRHFPGDVCIHSDDASSEVEKAFEIRDKPVSISDIQIFVKKCIDMGVRESAVLMASENQAPLDQEIVVWADELGIGLTLFLGWNQFVSEILFWSTPVKPDAAESAVDRIRQRLIEVEASEESVFLWDKLSRLSASQPADVDGLSLD